MCSSQLKSIFPLWSTSFTTPAFLTLVNYTHACLTLSFQQLFFFYLENRLADNHISNKPKRPEKTQTCSPPGCSRSKHSLFTFWVVLHDRRQGKSPQMCVLIARRLSLCLLTEPVLSDYKRSEGQGHFKGQTLSLWVKSNSVVVWDSVSQQW